MRAMRRQLLDLPRNRKKLPNLPKRMVFEKPKMFSIKRNQVEDPLETVEIEITQLQKKVALAK